VYIPVAVITNIPSSVEFGLSALLVLYTLPSTILLLWIGYWVYANMKLRYLLYSNSEKKKVIRYDDNPDMIIGECGRGRAVVVDFIEKETVVFIDHTFAEALNEEQLKAVYYHEVYHINHHTSNIRNLIRIPVVGYLIALLFINPVDAFETELDADQYAAERLGRIPVISAIKKTKNLRSGRVQKSSSAINKNRLVALFQMVWSVPVYILYRPSANQRISQLKN